MENKVETVENTEKKKEPMTTKQKVFLGLRIAFNVVFYALIIFLFLFSLMNIRGGNGTTNFPNIFGKGFVSVRSDAISMQRDEALKNEWPSEWSNYKIGGINPGDLLNEDVVNEGNAKNLKVGDVITFYDSRIKALDTHRIVDIRTEEDGTLVFTTQGDNIAQTTKYNKNWSPAEMEINKSAGIFEDAILVSNIRGVVTGVNSGAGKVLDTIQKNWLFIFVIPIIVLLVIEIFLVVRNIMLLRGEKNKLELADTKEAMLAEVEAEKEKMRQELLAELRAQGLAPAEDPKPEEPEATPEPQEDATEDAVVLTADEEKTEEPQEEKQEEVKEETNVEETPEAAPIEEAEEVEPESSEPATEEVKEETVEEKKETPKKAAPKKSSTTAKKSTSTTKKTTGTTKKSTKKTEE